MSDRDVSKKNKINKIWPKHGTQTQGGEKGPNHRKIGRQQKEDPNKKAAQKHQKNKGNKYIYMCNIYKEENICVKIYQRVMFNVRFVAYLLGNLNERFLQKTKEG